MSDNLMDKIISLCKRRGFIYPSSEIYGGFANAFDFGPLGAQMKKNIKDEWWRRFVIEREDIIGLDSAIIQNPKIWEASGHLSSFSDPLVECKKCHQRFRADHVHAIQKAKVKNQNDNEKLKKFMDSLTDQQRSMLICPTGGEHQFTEAKDFNLMFKTFIGVTEDSASTAYLRPETAQGIFTNFQNILQSTRIKIPFGIAQIGKAFRNEITPGNFIFRTREFEQAEIEFFIRPDRQESEKQYRHWVDEVEKFYLDLGIRKKNLKIREHAEEELSHYSSGTSDVEYKFPFGTSELAGIAQRTDYDLKQHMEHSGVDLRYFDETMQGDSPLRGTVPGNEKGESPESSGTAPGAGGRYIPYVIEPSLGIDRAMLAFLVDAYDESDGTDGRQAGEVTLRLHPKIAPIKAAVFPLVKKDKLPEIAKNISLDLQKSGIAAFYDESGSVGRRYRRQDEIGTPWCITVDFDSLTDHKATIRDRDTMQQERIKIPEIVNYSRSKI